MSDTRRRLVGWGRSTSSFGDLVRPSDRTEIAGHVVSAPARGVIARGLGRSYGDQAACAGGTVVDLTGVDTVGDIGDDGSVTVAAGASIQRLLERSLPLGWFVPVSPGTRAVTIGGAVAADVHGKNHHVAGSFCSHVSSLRLLTADGTEVSCGPDDRPDLFWATAGGLGLTGIVLDATVRLVPVETSTVLVDTTRLTDFDDILDAMVAADRTAPYSVAWLDLVGPAAGRSILTTGRFARRTEIDGGTVDAAVPTAPRPATITVPDVVPSGLIRRSTAIGFNELWFRLAPARRIDEPQSIQRFFHPLDGVQAWNRLHGRRGFVQWQFVVPDGSEDVLRRVVERLSASPVPFVLAVLKRFGDGNEGPMSFPLRGWTLAADAPEAGAALDAVLDPLDRMVAECGGRVYLAKDGRLDPDLVEVMYPRIEAWRQTCHDVDPTGRFASDLSRRLGLR